MNQTFLSIVSISVGVLLLASLITRALMLKYRSSEGLAKVWVIVKSWWLIVAFLLLAVGTAPLGLIIGFAMISILGTIEYYRHSRLESLRQKMAAILIAFNLLQYALLATKSFSIFFVMPMVTILICLPAVVIISADIKRLPEIVSSLVGPILTFHFLACLPATYLWIESSWGNQESAMLAVFLLILLTESNDVFQFISGKLFGRRKLVPLISPNKTEAGFIGGITATCILSTLFLPRSLGLLDENSDPVYWQGLFIGLTIAVFGIMGDLYFSSVKRYFGTKDFSHALPGHGGYLDRLDSLILSAPAFYYILWFFKVVVK